MKLSLATSQKSPGLVGLELIAVVGTMCASPTNLKGHRGVKMFTALMPTGQYPLGESPENTEGNFFRGQIAEKAYRVKMTRMTNAYSTITLVQELIKLSQSPARQI